MMAFPWSRSEAAEQIPPAVRRRRARNRRARQEETRRDKTRLAKERVHQRLAWATGTVLVLVLVLILAGGYYQKFYRPPRVWAGSVRNVEFTMGGLVDRIRVLQGLSGRVDLSVVPFEYLQDMLKAEILRQAAPGLGITITDEDIEEALRDRFYPQAPEGQESDPGQLDREFENNYRIYLTRTGLSDQDFRKVIEEQLKLQFLFALLGSGIEDRLEQVEVEWVLLDANAQVDVAAVRQRLDSEDFATVAQEVGVPGGYADTSGYVGWVPKGAFPDLDGLLFGDEESSQQPLAAGAISKPTYTSDGAYIVRKLSGPEVQDLADKMRIKLNAELVLKWQNDQLKRGSKEGWLKINFNSDLYSWVADQVEVSAARNQPEER